MFVVDNNQGSVSFPVGLSSAGVVALGDITAPSAPASGVLMASVLGAIRFAQHAPPSVTGARGDNAALASLLAQLASAGLIVDNMTA
jgi:hypothetical protein